jgi:hypothetical protein
VCLMHEHFICECGCHVLVFAGQEETSDFLMLLFLIPEWPASGRIKWCMGIRDCRILSGVRRLLEVHRRPMETLNTLPTAVPRTIPEGL